MKRKPITAIIVFLSLLGLAACGGGGGGPAAAPSPNNVPRFAYVANILDNTVSMFTVNAVTGQLRHNGYVAAGNSPRSVTVDPSGKFAYVANNISDDVSAYTINATTGALAAIDCDPLIPFTQRCAAGTGPASVTVDPSGKFAYVANAVSNNVSAYTINATTGVLTSIGAAVAAGTTPISVTVDPAGKFAYVANNGSNDISAYAIHATTGVLTAFDCDNNPLTLGGTCAAGTRPDSVTVDPSGKFAYVTNNGGGVSAYTINASTGALTAMAGSPFTAGTNPYSVNIHPSGKFAYVANWGSNNVSAYTINAATGVLTAFDCDGNLFTLGETCAAGTNPTSVTVDPSGKFAYVTNIGSDNISAYTIDATTGVLTARGPVAGRNGNQAMAMTRGTAAVTYTPKFAYVTNYNSNNVSAYAINATTGALTSVGTTVAVAGTNPAAVAVDPMGKFAYVTNNGTDNVSAYTINATTGALTFVGSVAAGTSPWSVSVHPSGKFAYVTSYDSIDVRLYTINASTGALTFVRVTENLNALYSHTVDPSGKFAYVTNTASNVVHAETINATTGEWAFVGSVPAGTRPVSVTVDPSGRFAYVANLDSSNVSAYTINATTGALTPVMGSPFRAGTGPDSVTVDPSGKFAYVANRTSSNVSAYTINATTGALAAIDCDPVAAGTQACTVGTTPYSVTVDPSGKFAYVANNFNGVGGNSVSAYTINATTGVLTAMAGSPFAAGTGPTSVTTTGTWE